MTDKNFGKLDSYFIAEVHNVNDADKAGRMQIKIHGKYDDTMGVPESEYPWGIPLQNVKSAAHNQIGSAPVGAVKGSTVFGVFLDVDHQYPLILGTIAKSGDPVQGTTTNGQVQVDPKTNSTPPGSRTANNSFDTRSTKNIKSDDNGSGMPPQTTDNDAKDITHEAIQSAKFSQFPALNSIAAAKDVLTLLQKIDPNNLSASLPQAVQALSKLKQMVNISSSMGNMQITSSAVSSGINNAASGSSIEYIIEALANALDSTVISDSSKQIIYYALMQLENQYNYSSDVQSIVNDHATQFGTDLLTLINSGNLTPTTLEQLIQKYISSMSDATTSNSLGSGINQSNILNFVSQLIPNIGPLIQGTLTNHLPQSVLNQNIIQEALKKFAKNQALIKMPNNGKKALAEQAVTLSSTMLNNNILNTISGLNLNLSADKLTQVQNVLGNFFK